MQNNPEGPYDEVFRNLARVVEDLVKNMPETQHARIVGYTIISRQTGSGDPEVFRAGPPEDDGEVPYEVVESDDELYITAVLPANPKNAPFADIEPQSVRIVVDGKITTILLDTEVDRVHSFYRVHRGIMDIALKKVKNP
jgi:HSP20 family molecular chaperone IbpA